MAQLPAAAAPAPLEQRRPVPGLRARTCSARRRRRRSRPYRVVMDAANGVAGKLAPLVFDGTPIDRVEMYFEVDGTFPNHEPNPLLEENSREIRERVRGREGRPRHRLGRRRRPLLLHRRGRRVRARRLRHGAARRGAAAQAPGRGHPLRPARQPRRARRDPRQRRRAAAQPRRARLLQAAHAPRGRCSSAARSPATTTSADNYNADSGFIPALLILELLSRRAPPWPSCWSRCARKYFISGEINSTVDDVDGRAARASRRASRDGEITEARRHLRRLRPTGTSTCAPPTPSRCCASTWAPTARRSWRRSATSCSA